MSKYWKKINLNPKGELTSDCTTRTLTFLLEKDYDSIRAKQNEIALVVSGKKKDWRAYYVFESMLMSIGWVKIILLDKILRWKLADLFKDLSIKILTESYGHISPIYQGKVWDNWDCTKGKVAAILFPYKFQKMVLKTLEDAEIKYVLD